MISPTNDPHNFDDEKLHLVAVISNTARYKRRYELYLQFRDYMEANPKVVLYTVEAATGTRPFEITEPDNPRHMQLRTREDLWIKESMQNCAMAMIPANAKYVAFVDADIKFARHDWAEETIHMLQSFPVVQMFSAVAMLDNNYVPQYVASGFAAKYNKSISLFDQENTLVLKEYGRSLYKTGLAFAFRKEAFEAIGGWYDRAIVGSGDYHFSAACINKVEWTLPAGIDERYREAVKRWGAHVYSVIGGRIGYVDGLINHYWHGEMVNRRYGPRWAILKEYDPATYIQNDWKNHGLIMYTKLGLESKIPQYMYEYFRLRNEDAV
jgi:hypothetical protein